MKLLLLGLILSSLFNLGCSSFAQASPSTENACWQKENLKEENRPFRSAQEWEDKKTYWESQRSISLNPIYIIQAYNLAKAEYYKADHLGSDKMAHCYIGCRIAQETNFETARFAAWYKEMKDLTDCSPRSSFEETDYLVTLFGAQLTAATPDQCVQLCSESLLSTAH